MTIPIIIGYIRCSSARRSLQKKVSPRAKSSTKHGPIVYTDNTQCVLLVLLFFPDHQSYIYFKIDQNMMIIIKCIWYSITRYIQRLSEWWSLANLILKGKQTQNMPLFCIHTARAVYLLCLPLFPCSKLPDACRENDILINSSWYPSNVLMIICKFWYSRKWFMISSDKSDDPQKFLNVSPRGSADILES